MCTRISDIDFDPEKVDVSFASTAGEILVCQNGASVSFDEAKAKEILLQDEIKILIDMKLCFMQKQQHGAVI